jgi:hypothetical protein
MRHWTRRAYLPYLVLLPLCVLVTVAQVREHRALQFAARRARWGYARALDQDQRTFAALLARYRQAVRDAGPSGPPRAELEAGLNGGQPFATAGAVQGEEAVYTDPTTGGRAVLRFRGDTWTGVTTYGPYFRAAYTQPPAPVSAARRVVYRAGLAACLLIVLVPWAGEPATNRTRVHWFVATAIVSTYLAFLGPDYLSAWNSMTEPDSPGWGLFVFGPLAVTLLLMAYGPPRFQRKPDYPACPQCRYNLTGNQSGVCPECGTAVTPAPPPDPAPPAPPTGPVPAGN